MGTRFLPATKAVPKEMLPVVDKPVVQYAVEEAKEAGFLDGKHSEQWFKRRKVMLMWFAARECARLYWGDALWGMHGPDEVEHGSMTDDPGEFPPGMATEEA